MLDFQFFATSMRYLGKNPVNGFDTETKPFPRPVRNVVFKVASSLQISLRRVSVSERTSRSRLLSPGCNGTTSATTVRTGPRQKSRKLFRISSYLSFVSQDTRKKTETRNPWNEPAGRRPLSSRTDHDTLEPAHQPVNPRSRRKHDTLSQKYRDVRRRRLPMRAKEPLLIF